VEAPWSCRFETSDILSEEKGNAVLSDAGFGLLRADLAAPWGSEGSVHMLQNFGNLVFTALLDPTDLIGATPPPNAPSIDGGAPLTGAELFEYEHGGAAGLELIANHRNLIENDLVIAPYSSINLNGYPYVGRSNRPAEVTTGLAAGAKVEASPIGIQVNQAKLLDLNAYLYSLRAPAGGAECSDDRGGTRGLPAAVHRERISACFAERRVITTTRVNLCRRTLSLSNKVDFYVNAPARPDLYPSWNGPVLAQRPGGSLRGTRSIT
jgi:hypothetical protein